MSSLGEPLGITSASRYKFIEHLATGGMAEIYAAEITGAAGASRLVAVKRVLREHTENQPFLRMFAKEARLSLRLQHPNIVQTYDVLDVNGELYIILELLHGTSLLDLLRILDGPEPALSTAQSLYVVERVLAGLHHAHELEDGNGNPYGIVHRDVSPHNIFLTLDGNVKLLDFGVAKMVEQGDAHTESGIVKGKILYMSPEHCQGLPVDRRADIFSAGVLLYTLLTNHHPFKKKNAYETMNAVINDDLVPASTHRPELSPTLDALLARAMEKDPDARFPTARGMQDAITAEIRENGLYTTDSEFSQFIEGEMGTIDRSSDPSSLPPDLVIGGVPEVHTGRHPAADAALAEIPNASIERIFGMTLLKLHGVINERFHPEALLPHLKGHLLVDTSGVQSITSYGIRGLLQVYEHAHVESIHHMRCSVPFLQQVGMVRRLLGGGKIVSFHLPYLDPETGNTFCVLLEGEAAQRALQTATPPPQTCPGFPDREALFDEDPGIYLNFIDDFLVRPEPDLLAVIEGLAAEHKNRQVEKSVDDNGTQIWIRRPLQAGFRWRTLLQGIEGKVILDLDDTPSWTEEGIQSLVLALDREGEALQSLTVLHAPYALLDSLKRHQLADRLVASTGRVHTLCQACGVPRRIAVPLPNMVNIQTGARLAACPACGGDLLSTEEFIETAHCTPVPASSNTTPPPSTPVTHLPRTSPLGDNKALTIGLVILLFVVAGALFLSA